MKGYLENSSVRQLTSSCSTLGEGLPKGLFSTNVGERACRQHGFSHCADPLGVLAFVPQRS